MKRTLLIHDLSEVELETLELNFGNMIIIHADNQYAPCRGCFGCWLKTPGKCVLKDALQDIGTKIASSDEVILISKNCYGGLSPAVKNIIDRGIAISLPFFTYRERRIHHMLRYKKRARLTICLYGEMTKREKETAEKLVHANKLNGCYQSSRLLIAKDALHLEDVLHLEEVLV